MKNRKKMQSVLSMSLVLLLILSSCAVLVGAGRSQPENPIGKRTERLRPETASGSSSLWGQSGDNKGTDGSGDATDQEETQPPEQTEPTQPPETTPTTPTEATQPTEPEQTDPTEATDPTENTQDPTDSTDPDNTDPDNPDDGKDDNQGGDSDKDDQGGGSNTDNPGKGDDGGDGDNGGNGGNSGDNPSDDDEPRIYTDLQNNAYYTKSDLPDGNLTFLAYPMGKGNNLSVKVILQNSNTSANGLVLESLDGKHYTAPLVFNEVSYITLILKENGENIRQPIRFRISYYADKADENNPEVGDYPPTIVTSLDGESLDFTTQHLLFWVRATTSPELGGKTIHSNQIQVWLDGELQTKKSGDDRPEYDIYFPLPNIEGTENHVIKVLAWDGNGNSTYKYYNVTFTYIPEGIRFGKVTVVLDATAAGLGVIDTGTVEVNSGDSVASAVLDFLTLYGYNPTYDGSAENAFYLRKIGRSNIGKYAFIPPKLQELLERDGATFTGSPARDSLGEFDFTRGSGWMYAIDGDVYPGRSMSLYPVQPGMTIYLRFTLAYGKDIGGFVDDGASYGSLSSYCRMWVDDDLNGRELAHDYQEVDHLEPTATEDGYIDYMCSRCHETKRETLPATGEETNPTDPSTEPTDPEPSTEPTEPETDPPTEPDPTEPETEPEESQNPEPEEPDPDGE